MINPCEFPARTTTNLEQCLRIEEWIDRQLQANKRIQRWPLQIVGSRSKFEQCNIDKVLQKYRDAGWQVWTDGSGLATFDLPEGK